MAVVNKDDVLAQLDIPAFYRRELERLSGPAENGEAKALCPFHDDKNPSLSVNLKSGAYHCHACGAKGDVFNFLQARYALTFPQAVQKLAEFAGVSFAAPVAHLERKSKELPECPFDWNNPTHTYTYFYPGGAQAFDILRCEKEGYRKAIRQSAGFDERGNRLKGLNGAELCLYNLHSYHDRPGLDKSSFVVIVEGENKAEALIGLGVPATCNSGGAGKWKDDYSAYLKGKAVVILPDNDKAGKEHALQVAASVFSHAESVKIVELPGLPEKGDIIDWFKMPGNDKERLQALMNDAPEWKPEQPTAQSVAFISVETLVKMDLPPREHILYPIIPEQGSAMLFAPRGIGKTYLGMSMAHASATGSSLFGSQAGPKYYAAKARRVLYLDGEMALVDLQKRIRGIVGENMPLPGYFNILNPEMLPVDEIMPNFSTPKGQEWLDKQLEGIELLVLDNLSCLCGSGRENETESWLPVQKWILQLRRRGISVLIIHHAGKNGEQRGTSAREDILDTVIRLRRPDDYVPEEDGARFVVELTKARGIAGEDAAPFEAMLTMENGKLSWATKEIGQSELLAVVDLMKAGKSFRFTAQELNLPLAKVQRLKAKGEKLGLL